MTRLTELTDQTAIARDNAIARLERLMLDLRAGRPPAEVLESRYSAERAVDGYLDACSRVRRVVQIRRNAA